MNGVVADEGIERRVLPVMKPIFLLGHPVSHSRSPQIHNPSLQKQGVDAIYLLADVAPEDLPDAVSGLRALGALGANVTIPHKESVLPLLDDCSDRARAVGAVNTLVCTTQPDGSTHLWGDNTDVPGFLEPLMPQLAALRGQPAVVLGAGGSARAVVYALLTEVQPSHLTLVARTTSRGEAIGNQLAPYTGGTRIDVQGEITEEAFASARLIVNCTPVGMHPKEGVSPVPHAMWQSHHIAYDLIYNPSETQFMTDARAAGAMVIGGMPMLIAQADYAYRHWTGQPLDRSHLL